MKGMNINTGTIGEIVASDYRAASVFKEAGIDFCCGGKKSVEEACKEKSVDSAEIFRKLRAIESSENTITHNFNEWNLGFLCDYIINTHHKFVLKSLPELVSYTQKIASVHGERHPELTEVSELFLKINNELLQHLKNEEEVLFPSIRNAIVNPSHELLKVIKSEISRMSGEHEFAGGAMDKINVITNSYSIPADGCNTYHVTFKLLEQFEEDLHTHVHLENNILYPKALKIK
jgi:regulator of cell morphogenesis and NO signaling